MAQPKSRGKREGRCLLLHTQALEREEEGIKQQGCQGSFLPTPAGGEKAQTLAPCGHLCPFCCEGGTGAFPPSVSWQKSPLAGLACARHGAQGEECFEPGGRFAELDLLLGWWFSILRMGTGLKPPLPPHTHVRGRDPVWERGHNSILSPLPQIILFQFPWLHLKTVQGV